LLLRGAAADGDTGTRMLCNRTFVLPRGSSRRCPAEDAADFLSMVRVYIDHKSEISEWMDDGIRESVHHAAPTFKFHFSSLLADILVVSYALSCTECLH